jgi:hypothetical protein
VLFQAILGFLRAEIIENDMPNLYRRKCDRTRSIQGGLDGIFYGSDDKYLSHGLEGMGSKLEIPALQQTLLSR